jgi:VWFA-related protein
MRKIVVGLAILVLACAAAWLAFSQSDPPAQNPAPQKPAEQKPAEQKPQTQSSGPQRPVDETVVPSRRRKAVEPPPEQQPPAPPPAPAQPSNPQQQPPAQQPRPVDITGPERPVGETVSIPRRPPQKPKRRPAGEAAQPGEVPYAISVNVDLVSVDVSVQDRQGQFLPGLTKKNFRVLEDGMPQNIQTFEATEAPMTVVMVIEFNNLYQRFWSETWYQTLTASHGFLETLRLGNCASPDMAARPGSNAQTCDWVAVVAYDMRPEILQDFTQSREAAVGALQRLRFPAFSEANLYDTLDDTLSRLKDVSGKKGIVLISTGIDTFSKLTYDKILKIIQSNEVPIYPIGLMQMIRELADARGGMGPIARMDFLQADNAMRTFAQYSGGRAFFPRFYGEFPGIFSTVSALLRHQYTLGYAPTNTTRDGKFRKLKVELVDDTGKLLKIVDQKGKEVKYVVSAKNGYYAPKGEETVQ